MQIPRPDNDDRINEYKTSNISTLAFPKLFPYGETCPKDDI